MTHIRNDRTPCRRRRAGTTLVLAAATGGLLAAAMAGSPTARADDPFADIAADVQSSITIGEGDFSDASTDFSATPADTDAGLIAAFAGFDNIFISPTDYTLDGLIAAATGTDFSGFGGQLEIPDAITSPDQLTATGQEAIASDYASLASTYGSLAEGFLSSGDYYDAAVYGSLVPYEEILAGQADTLAALFGAGF